MNTLNNKLFTEKQHIKLKEKLSLQHLISKHLVSGLVLTSLLSCSSPSGVSEKISDLSSQKQWSAQHNSAAIAKQSASNKAQQTLNDNNNMANLDGWLLSLKDENLAELVNYALNHNYSLNAQRMNVEIAQQRLNVSDATDFPELSLSMASSRNKRVNDTATSYQNNNEINLQLTYELDLWGRLSDQQLQNRLSYAAAQAQFEGSKINLVATIATTWFNLLEAQQLLTLFTQRAKNLENNLQMIQSAYRLGLSGALDVYLTQNDVNRELARIAEQQQKVQVTSRQLELLMGDYPSASLRTTKTLPLLTDDIPVGLPGDLLTRRADIRASWYELLSLDAGLAVAHKERFPRISLNANTGASSSELNNLLNGSALAWSLIGNLTTPLFNAGKLESLEEQARLSVVKKEQEYLQQVYQAFATVEDQISNRSALNQRFSYYRLAEDNALAAEHLSFNEYLKGLVTYTTVLESQRRAFDAQTTIIELTNQLLQNRIAVYIALGGDFTPAKSIDVAEVTMMSK